MVPQLVPKLPLGRTQQETSEKIYKTVLHRSFGITPGPQPPIKAGQSTDSYEARSGRCGGVMGFRTPLKEGTKVFCCRNLFGPPRYVDPAPGSAIDPTKQDSFHSYLILDPVSLRTALGVCYLPATNIAAAIVTLKQWDRVPLRSREPSSTAVAPCWQVCRPTTCRFSISPTVLLVVWALALLTSFPWLSSSSGSRIGGFHYRRCHGRLWGWHTRHGTPLWRQCCWQLFSHTIPWKPSWQLEKRLQSQCGAAEGGLPYPDILM